MPVLAQSHLRVFEGIVHAANWLTSKVKPSSTPQHLVTGQQGELDGFFYLRRQGYVVVARRYRSALRPGDIDLIAWQGDTLCFVEVKTRSSRAFASAESSVDGHKRDTMRRLARIYLRSLATEPSTRFDVLAVYPSPKNAPVFELFKSAFDWY